MDEPFEHLCRICAANTKSKSNSVVESVFIFKTAGLKDKISKHLYLNVAENDPLPKVLCKSCYRQVEATASLTNIAKHTQRVLFDFISTSPKHARQATSQHSTTASNASSNNNYNEQQRHSNVENDEFRPIMLSRAPETTITLAPPAHAPLDEVVISLTKKDNQLRQQQQQQQQQQKQQLQQQKLQRYQQLQQQQQLHEQQQRAAAAAAASAAANNYGLNAAGINIHNLCLPTRRNSVYQDVARFGSTPMSIAQRSMQVPPTLTPLHSEVTVSKLAKASPEKKHSPAGVINFIQTHGRITGISNSGSIVKSSSNSSSNNSSSSNVKLPAAAPTPAAAVPVAATTAAAAAATAVSPTINSAGVPNLPSSVIRQKRRNLKNTLNNIKALNSGQVSLLKSAQQRQMPPEEQPPMVTATVVPHKALYDSEPSIEEALPEHIIIAAPKKKKEEPPAPPRQCPPKLQKILPAPPRAATPAPAPVAITEAAATPATTPTPPATPANTPAPTTTAAPAAAVAVKEPKSKVPPSMNSITEAISLGNVIRDPDLLKLILKALKWPVTAGNCEEQMTRLKSSKFAVIMSDSNLLQDTDLTQLLGPYLGPMLAAAQQQQQKQQQGSATAASTPSPSPPQSVKDLASTMPYKLPPETSVQLVPSSPTEQEAPAPQLSAASKKSSGGSKRPQRKSRTRDNSQVAGEPQPQAAAGSSSNAALVSNELLNMDTKLIPHPADALNEALISMLQQQQEKRSRRQAYRRRSPSAGINLEDIVLVEPQPPLEPDTIEELPMEPTCFKLPSPKRPEEPPITRPIIKRRKTVIQALKQRELSAASCNKPPAAAAAVEKHTEVEPKAPAAAAGEEQSTAPAAAAAIEAVAEQTASELEIEKQSTESPSSTVPEAAGSQSSSSSSSNNSKAVEEEAPIVVIVAADGAGKAAAARKSGNVKSALGQKLLEAIGLQQLGKNVAPESSRDTLRSALKRSLKQAQEQQQQLKRVKQEEPVKQLADSTTKPNLADCSEEHKKAIAERELALLKSKSKLSPEANKSDGKTERTDVSSSSSRNRRKAKPKTDANEDEVAAAAAAAAELKLTGPERWDEDDDLPLRTDAEKSPEGGTRPTRTSKTMSRYYKTPSGDKLKSQHAMGTRSTRQR